MPLFLSAGDIFVKPAEEMFENREGTPFNGQSFDRDFTVDFLVQVKIPGVTELIVCQCPGLPLPWTPHPSDLAALCIRLSGKRKEKNDWQFWIVTAKYSTTMPRGGPLSQKGDPDSTPDNPKSDQNNPENDPPDIEWDFEQYQWAPEYDLDRKAFVNSAQQPYAPAKTFEFADQVLMISRNELNFNRKVASQFSMSVNNAPFLDAEPGTVLCMPIKGRVMWRGSIMFWRVSYRLRFGTQSLDGSLRAWDPIELLDAGLMEIKPVAGQKDKFELVNIKNNGVAVSQPVCLDGQGRQAKPRFVAGVGVDANGNPNPGRWVVDKAFNQYHIRKREDFSNLLRYGVGRSINKILK